MEEKLTSRVAHCGSFSGNRSQIFGSDSDPLCGGCNGIKGKSHIRYFKKAPNKRPNPTAPTVQIMPGNMNE